MDFDYNYNDVGSIGQFQELKLATCFRGEEFGISSLSFDPQEDLLWAATYGVSIWRGLLDYLFILLNLQRH